MKLLFLPVILMVVIFSSCSGDDDIIDRISTLNDIPADAELSIDYLPVNLFEIPIEQNLDLRQLIKDQLGVDGTLNQVKDVELDAMVIELISADNRDNFDFLDSVILGVRTDDLAYMEVASLDEVPTGVTSIDLNTVNDFYIDEYAKSETLKLVVKFKSTQDVYNLSIKLKMKFDAQIDPSL